MSSVDVQQLGAYLYVFGEDRTLADHSICKLRVRVDAILRGLDTLPVI